MQLDLDERDMHLLMQAVATLKTMAFPLAAHHYPDSRNLQRLDNLYRRLIALLPEIDRDPQ